MASTTLISTTSFGSPTGNYDGSSTTFTSIEVKAAGYLGFSGGLHTIAWKITGFSGSITVQASLTKTPSETDWFDVRLGSNEGFAVDTTGLVTASAVPSTVTYSVPSTSSRSFNVTGNFVWLRVKVTDFSAGTINFLQVNI